MCTGWKQNRFLKLILLLLLSLLLGLLKQCGLIITHTGIWYGVMQYGLFMAAHTGIWYGVIWNAKDGSKIGFKLILLLLLSLMIGLPKPYELFTAHTGI